MRLPGAAAQVSSAPVKALRGFFAGIGQLLVTADWFKATDARRQAVRPEPEAMQREPKAAGQELSGQELAELDLSEPEPADGYESLTAPRRAAAIRRGLDSQAGRHRAPDRQGPAASAQTPTRRFRSLDSTGNVRLLKPGEPAVEPEQDLPPDDEHPGGPDLPLPGYDQLTLPSLRSRLRNLDTAQLRALADYEKATANRADVVAMFERRIAKLQATAPHAS